MRNLLRTRKQLAREPTSHVERPQKTLEDANVKLDSVISDIMGLSGRRMVEALIAGERDPERLAQLAHRRIKAVLCEALRGRVTSHHRFLLRLHLKQIDTIDDIDQEVDAHVKPFRTAVQHLITAPGIDVLSACGILAEIGRDMSCFATAGLLMVGLCPNAQRHRLEAQFHRLRARRGAKKAIGAVAASILTAIYHVLRDGTLYHDHGSEYFNGRPEAAQTAHLVTRLQKLGYAVQITPLAA